MPFSGAIFKKTQRLEMVRGDRCIYQRGFLTPNDSNPACDKMLPTKADFPPKKKE
eukprot:COSAG02_NODE_2492_length_8691_cov_45.293412_12_plen_55_part_00